MWELSICVDCKNLDIARFVYQTLKSHSESTESVVTCYEQFDSFYILIACPIARREDALAVVEKCVCKVICNFYKERFLSENLRLPLHENIGLAAFKKALINFDRETDLYIICKNLVLNENLHLDSFYNFKLKALRDKWAELVALANENSDYLGSSEAFFDLLRFLIDNLQVCEDEISVFEDENGWLISGQSEDCPHGMLTKEGLVCSLIELCPKKINLFCRTDDATAGFLSKIFEERVNVCYNKSLEKVDRFSVLK